MTSRLSALALALLALVPIAGISATPTPKPVLLRMPPMSKVPLTTSFIVEVNRLGQVVRVKSGHGSKDPLFNAHTYGNVLQMFIRKQDGSAEVGLYKVIYHQDPKTLRITRDISIVSAGGDWGDHAGAVHDMLDEQQQADKKRSDQQSGATLPSLNQITKTSPSPSAHP